MIHRITWLDVFHDLSGTFTLMDLAVRAREYGFTFMSWGGRIWDIHGVKIEPTCLVNNDLENSVNTEPPASGAYKSLRAVLECAIEQASKGKGYERHASGEPFTDQQICQISRWLGSCDFNLGQAVKKCLEVNRIKTAEAKVSELLGAINYIAAAVILLREAQ